MSVLQLQYIEGYVENLRKGQNRLGYTVNINLLRQGSTPPNFSNSPKILIQTVTEFVAGRFRLTKQDDYLQASFYHF